MVRLDSRPLACLSSPLSQALAEFPAYVASTSKQECEEESLELGHVSQLQRQVLPKQRQPLSLRSGAKKRAANSAAARK
jgi:hypothetical protein